MFIPSNYWRRFNTTLLDRDHAYVVYKYYVSNIISVVFSVGSHVNNYIIKHNGSVAYFWPYNVLFVRQNVKYDSYNNIVLTYQISSECSWNTNIHKINADHGRTFYEHKNRMIKFIIVFQIHITYHITYMIQYKCSGSPQRNSCKGR